MAHSPLLFPYRVVLVEPRTPGNIGACARLLANFECDDWIIVNPRCEWTDWDAKKLATGTARELLERARTESSLAAAVADCHAAVGFTRREGKLRVPSIEPGGIAGLGGLEAGKTALVFGNEETGLSSDDLGVCTQICSIPTSEAMASMNLSHAVAVVLARVYEAERERANLRRARRGRFPKVAVSELDGLMEHWNEFLRDIGMTQAGNPERLVSTVRQLLARAQLTGREARALRGMISKAQVKLGTRSRGRRVPS